MLVAKPELLELLHAMEREVLAHPAVPANVLERCRVRVAQLFGLEPSLPAEGDLDPGASACVVYAEQFVLDVHSVTDAHAAAVTDAIGSDGLVVLTSALALWEATMRIERTLG